MAKKKVTKHKLGKTFWIEKYADGTYTGGTCTGGTCTSGWYGINISSQKRDVTECLSQGSTCVHVKLVEVKS